MNTQERCQCCGLEFADYGNCYTAQTCDSCDDLMYHLVAEAIGDPSRGYPVTVTWDDVRRELVWTGAHEIATAVGRALTRALA